LGISIGRDVLPERRLIAKLVAWSAVKKQTSENMNGKWIRKD
jgi:cation transport regulator ChaB